ncbi:MAG: hypothetical protein ACR2QC_06710 [Gammaproteobacteria bacterium]
MNKIAEFWKNIAGGRPAGAIAVAIILGAASAVELASQIYLYSTAAPPFDGSYVFGETTGADAFWFGYSLNLLVLLLSLLAAAAFLLHPKNWTRKCLMWILAFHIAVALIPLVVIIAAVAALEADAAGADFSLLAEIIAWLLFCAAALYYLGRREVVARFLHSDGEAADDLPVIARSPPPK